MKFLTTTIIVIVLWTKIQAQDFARKLLDESARHQEWVQIQTNGRTLHAFLIYPEVSEPVTSVIVIHENRGLTDWVRSFADRLAGQGFLVIAPDLLSGYSREFTKTSDFPDRDAAREALYKLDQEQIRDDLHAVYANLINNQSCNGKVAVMGFCWGGSQSFLYATNNWDLNAAFVFYGRAPKAEAQIEEISAPIYGFYGQNDHRITSTIQETKARMKDAGKTYEYRIYQGAGHAFMRKGDDPVGSKANKDASKNAWLMVKKILTEL